jgi:hypothetical protein
MKSYELYFQAYHEGELWDRNDLVCDGTTIHKIWDGYMDNLPLEEAEVPEEMVEKFYQARIGLNSNRKVLPVSYRSKILLDAPAFDREADVWLLFITHLPTFKAHLRGSWAKHLLQQETHRGADDGTYDYYPDLWFASFQIFSAVGMKKEYYQLRKKLFGTTDYGDADGDLMELIPG